MFQKIGIEKQISFEIKQIQFLWISHNDRIYLFREISYTLSHRPGCLFYHLFSLSHRIVEGLLRTFEECQFSICLHPFTQIKFRHENWILVIQIDIFSFHVFFSTLQRIQLTPSIFKFKDNFSQWMHISKQYKMWRKKLKFFQSIYF